MKILENKTISLRALEPEDLEILYKWENDTDSWHLSNTLSPFSKYTLKKYLEQAHVDIFEAKQLRLIIQRNSDAKVLGAVDLFDFDPFHLRAGVGILIGDKHDRKMGYGTESLQCLKEYGFTTLGLKQLYCNICEDNQVSLKLFINQGFVITGQKKDWLRKGDDWFSEYTLQLVKA